MYNVNKKQQFIPSAVQSRILNALPSKSGERRICFHFPDSVVGKTRAVRDFVERHRGSVVVEGAEGANN